jgi:6-phospho-3-hexuloisomerase
MDDFFTKALGELGTALAQVDQARLDEACRLISGVRRVGLYGCGREGLMVRALAMRLYHCGLDAHTFGEMDMPPLEAGDLFFASSGPGDLASVNALVRVARNAGAQVMLLTSQPEGPDPRLADFVLVLPAQTMASDQSAAASAVLPMGSIFEGSMFLLFEAMVARIAKLRGETAATMRARHTNIE